MGRDTQQQNLTIHCQMQAAVMALSSSAAHAPSAGALRNQAVLVVSIADSVEREHIMMVRLCRLWQSATTVRMTDPLQGHRPIGIMHISYAV